MMSVGGGGLNISGAAAIARGVSRRSCVRLAIYMWKENGLMEKHREEAP